MLITLAELIAKFVALIANLRTSEEALKQVEEKHPLPELSAEGKQRMSLPRMNAVCAYAPYLESAHYIPYYYHEGTPERLYAEHFTLQQNARKPVNRAKYWVREMYRLQKTYIKYGDSKQNYFRDYSQDPSIPDLLSLLCIPVSYNFSSNFNENHYDVVMAIIKMQFEWKAYDIDTDEFDAEERRTKELLSGYAAILRDGTHTLDTLCK